MIANNSLFHLRGWWEVGGEIGVEEEEKEGEEEDEEGRGGGKGGKLFYINPMINDYEYVLVI